MRESPARHVIDALTARGAHCTVVDPHVGDDTGLRVSTRLEAAQLADADAVVVLTDHPEFDPQLVHAHASYVLDTRRTIPPGDHIEHL
ncbi:UDP-glucose/GDP-mannose dehydrogenase family protein [Streptomyces sp. NPDC046832]|uniref:UDP-glucose/GDP-mannose dehydrogenase family protein n=1 Tax=Streptomyces sp. NPDC046832 TaxID=3155020 RepID=UPI0033D3A59D